MSGIKHFRSRLEGRPFQLWTDHKPLIFALHRVSPPTSGRQQRHHAFISEYTNQLVYLPGTSYVVADALSRPAEAAAGIEWVCAAIADKSPLEQDMALRQILCPQVQALRSSPGLRIITQKVGDLDLIGDSSTGIFRGPRRPAGYTSLHSNQQNRAGNRFPLARRQGFLHAPLPFSTPPPLGPPATAERRPD